MTSHVTTPDTNHDQGPDQGHGESSNGGGLAPYLRFAAMIATSTAVMYALTYTNLFTADHAHWSEERVYMAVLMGAAMAVVMLTFMWGRMYPSTGANLAVLALAVLIGAGALYLSRSQALVDDSSYMRAMIPHHSIAILTSERADIDDVRVRALADSISATQVEEIKEMEWLLDDIAENGEATTPEEGGERPVPDFSTLEDDATATPTWRRWADPGASPAAGPSAATAPCAPCGEGYRNG